MQHFLFVPMEGGQTEMAALTSTRTNDAIKEAGQREFGGRTGYLFDGDAFVEEIRTAAGVTTDNPLVDAARDRDQVAPTASIAPRPG